MTFEGWKGDLSPQDLFALDPEEWEIEFMANFTSHNWLAWTGQSWSKDYIYRARPRPPKMQVVKSRCWRGPLGQLAWWDSSTGLGEGFVRFPAGDIEGEVEV